VTRVDPCSLCVAVCCSLLQSVAVCWSGETRVDPCSLDSIDTLQHTATHCCTLQHTATHCNILQHTATYCNTLQHTATHCNALQHTATHCSTLQHTATHCNRALVPHQHTATLCSTLQRIARVQSSESVGLGFGWSTYCNTPLQHSATYCHTLPRTVTHCDTPCKTNRLTRPDPCSVLHSVE